MARIFISSTTEDLKDYRAAAVTALRHLGHEVVVLDELAASAGPPLEQSRAAIDSSDLFVSIIAWRYGFIPTVDNPERHSFVELEFRHARERGKPTLVFMLKEDVPWPPQFVDSGEGADRLAAFRKEVLQRVTVGFFTSAEDLAQKLATAVSTLAASLSGGGAQSEPPSPIALPAGIDPFELAWRLVVDFKAEPALLRHMDPNALKEAIEKWAHESSQSRLADPSRWYEAAQKQLQAKQTDLSPNALWLAWMHTTRSHLLPVPGNGHTEHQNSIHRDADRDRDRDRGRGRV